MTWVDAALLDVIERICRRVQVVTGRTNVWLAVQFTNLSIVVFFIWAGAFVRFGGRSTRIVVGVVCLLLLYFLSQTVFRTSIEASEQHAFRRVAGGTRNPRRLRDAPLRLAFLTVTVFLSYPLYWLYSRYGVPLGLLTLFLLELTTALLYLLACDPLPPEAARAGARVAGVSPASRAVPESSEGQTAVRASRADWR
jgi:hypothetical protein